MIRHCDGTDPNLIGEDGTSPCACRLSFEDARFMVIYPHRHVGGEALMTGEQVAAFRARGAEAGAALRNLGGEVMTEDEAAEFARRFADLAARGFPAQHKVISRPFTGLPFPDRPEHFAASVIIVWPQPRDPQVLDGWKVAILDARTGEMITTITRLAVLSDPQGIVWARARMLVNADGEPIISGPGGAPGICVSAGGEVAEGDFDLLVTGMRVAGQPGSAWPDEAGVND